MAAVGTVPEGTIPAFFAPQELRRVFAAGEVLFLADAARLEALGGDRLLRELVAGDRRRTPQALAEGAAVPAIGLEPGYYTVMARSTETEGAMALLSNIVFSAGFILGTASGELQLWSGDRVAPDRDAERGEAVDRRITVTPGWYRVTVVAGIRLDDEGEETREWVCCFLLEPSAAQPEPLGDMSKTLGLFGS
ncbi:hypothetical protein FTO74_03005 [Granulicella sp. WH15]|uniref:hypothetical protein n=1 Tax=Granulicella sp. WH15 TaxID=2602070 RepID=UPI001366BA4A|nr:hypothetical protein [Granulicella sp. WH15]QHN02453.1 hypothetical protein FTO74_03005 [Granulicella sp. WH15]